MRQNIQSLQNVNFIFSGSNKHLLANIFTNAKRPFYQSTERMHLEEIPSESYYKFIASNFEKKNIHFENKVISFILEWTKRHTYFVQYLCNRIVSLDQNHINNEIVRRTMHEILQENVPYYFEYRNLLTLQQWKLIIAIAKEQGISKITNANFIRKHNLSNPSTVRRGTKSLIEKELIYNKEGTYYVYDVFFSRWLENK